MSYQHFFFRVISLCLLAISLLLVGGCTQLQNMLRPALPTQNQEWIKEVQSIRGYFKKKPKSKEIYKENKKKEGNKQPKIQTRMEKAAYTLMELNHRDHPEMKKHIKLHLKNHIKLGQLRGELFALEMKARAKKDDPYVCTPSDHRKKAKKTKKGKPPECPYPDDQNVCQFNVHQGLTFSNYYRFWDTYPKIKKQIDYSHFKGYKKHIKSLNNARNACYKRLIKANRPHKDIYIQSDRKQRLKEARQVWKSKFGDEPLVKLVISNKQWTRKKYDQWKDGIKYPYDHSRLNGYTYRRVNGVIRGELITWWKNNIEGTEWVEICPRTEAFGDCFYYDLLEENLNK